MKHVTKQDEVSLPPTEWEVALGMAILVSLYRGDLRVSVAAFIASL